MSTAAKIVDPRVMNIEVSDDEIIVASGRRTDDQRTVGLVMAFIRGYPGAATTLRNSWRRPGDSLA